MPTLNELQELKDAAWRAKNVFDAKWHARESEIRTAMYVQLGVEMGNEKEAVTRAAYASTAAWEAERDRLALENSAGSLPYPEGTLVVQWDCSIYGGGIFRPSRNRGVMQVFRKGDPHLGRGYSAPTVGQVVIRPLKKDGTPGKQVITSIKNWLPEGVAHPEAEKKA